MRTIKQVMHSTTLAAAVTLAAVCALPASAASVTVGNHSTANCLPFSCSPSLAVSTYQQVYSATAFSGPLSFNTISFFHDPQFGSGSMDSASFVISFSTTSKAVDGLEGIGANNVGGDSQAFGTYNVSGNIPSILSFTGNSFSYNPALGNLLMNVEIVGGANTFGGAYFQADGSGDDTRRYLAFNGSPEGSTDTIGLRTEFSNVSAIPEPESYAMMIAGLGLLGFAARRRKQKAA